LLLADAYCNNIKNLKVFGDSQLAIRFMTGRYKSHDAYLSTVVQSAFSLAKKIPNISFIHIARSFNAKADKLSNKALKEKKEVAEPNVD
jgi:ribonuclease HI